jgi:8-oxo-dGTP pyrophosphatase MutT (NUDIX family)
MAEERDVGHPEPAADPASEPPAEPPGRGGRQLIPRPPGLRPGGPPPWHALAPEHRIFTLADVRDRLTALPPPRESELHTPSSRAAAVLVAVFEENAEAHVVLTKRPLTMPSHRGEIAFPGGKREPGDVSLIAVALREANEEIGLDPAVVEVAGELDSLSTVASQYTIAPIVGLLSAPPVLRPDPREVDVAFAVPVSDLLAPEVFREELWDLWGSWRAMAFFDLPGETVWGATARILAGFLRFLTDARVPGGGTAR